MEWHHVLKLARVNAGFSLREVEKQADVSNSYVSQIENGRIKEPSFFKMIRLLTLYNLSARDIGTTDNTPGRVR